MESKVFIFMTVFVFLPAVSCQVVTPQPTACGGDEFRCLEDCILLTKKCDGVIDCVDGSDEFDCYNQTCRGHQFQCIRELKCIPQGLVCNGFWDCNDGSDEQQCERQLTCPHGEWSCPSSNSMCISFSRLCDGNNDCFNGADEEIPCSNLRCGILSCENDCRAAPGGGICVCPQGYTLTNDSRTCIDLDECLSFGYCDQECTNREGSYTCSCSSGYSINSRNHCIATGSQSAFLIYTHGRDVVKTTSLRGDTTNSIARSFYAYTLDYHWRKQKIFWSDVWSETVYSVPLTGGDMTIVRDAGFSLARFDGMAVDWIADKIYTLEYYTQIITVMELNGTNRAWLLSSDVQPISGLAIDPTEGFMFFSYRGENARLVKAYMDGTHEISLVTDYIFSVTDIIADIPAKRIYWVDSMLDYLESVRYDGRSRQIVSVGFDVLPHPVGIAVFEEYAYASDSTKRGVVKLNRFDRNPRGSNLLHSESSVIRKLKVVHPNLQPVVDNPCGTDNGGCSHLCILSHITDSNGIGYRCKCPLGMELSQDKRSCADITRILLYQYLYFIKGFSLDSDIPEEAIEPVKIYRSDTFTVDASRRTIIFGGYHSILRKNLDGTGYHELPWSNTYYVTSLAYDWLADNIYYTDSLRDVVAVTKIHGSFNGSRDLVTNLVSPGLVAVAPVAGYLFWAERAPRISKIERGWMDGSHRTVLVDTLIGTPWELVVDNELSRIYWMDTVLKKIERIDFTGQNRVMLNIQQMANPTGLTLFGEYLLFGDRRSLAIARVSKEDGSGYYVFRDNLPGIDHLGVIDKNAQTGSNTCSNSGGMCSHFCFAAPGFGRSCGCPYGLKLDSDHMTCINNSVEEPLRSCPSYMEVCDSGQCYYSGHHCDGHPDCSDGTDERDCADCSRYSFTCGSGECVGSYLRCNHQEDCEDGSDEEGCFQVPCAEGKFQCANGKCINPYLKCDTENNCGDASDESNCDTHQCGEGMFSCASHQRCVPVAVLCDGQSDCGDGSDEQNCDDTSCSSSHRWQCANGQCIVADNLCDRFYDCDDHSDETDCPTVIPGECEEGQFHCQLDEECIPGPWECDGHRDCSDFSDEHDDCGPVTCPTGMFKCNNNLCISMWLVCNGYHNCGDGSDEDDCPPAPFQCREHEYQCFETEICILITLVCNGETDCPDGDDESSLCNNDTCHNFNGGCEQVCRASPYGALCDCFDGYTKNGTKRCDDLNECNTPGICSQSCTNSGGSYVCSCTEGYDMVNNGKCVHSDSTPPKLIVSDYYHIKAVDITTGAVDFLVSWESPIALDWDIADDLLFWSDWQDHAIYSFNGTFHEKIVSGGVFAVEAIAVDWVARHIYWLDYVVEAIEVSNMDGSDRMFLAIVEGNLRGFGLDPRDGMHLIFWTDWSQNAKIERIDMDGRNRRVILSENLYWVNGLTVDLPAQRLFYADARLDYIASCDYEGENIQVMEIMELVGSHVHSLTVFEDWLYWTDRVNSRVLKVEKFQGRNATVVHRASHVIDVHAKHPALHPLGTNYCENSPCQHLCLLSTTDPFYSCHCPVGKVLSEDAIHCTDPGPSILFVRSNAIWSSWLDSNYTQYSTVPVFGTSVFDVEFDLRDGYLYWTEASYNRENANVHRVSITGANKTDFVPSAYYGRSHALAIDWITRNLFWTNSVRNSIEVIRMDGELHHRNTIISKTAELDIGNPLALCLDPFKGMLFWADNGAVGVHRHIASALMDGTNYRKLVVDDLSDIGGLTIDVEAARIYWSDQSYQKVESCQLDGTDRRQVVGDLHNPRGLTVYGNHLYIVDSNLQQVVRVDKNTGLNQHIYRENMIGVVNAKVMARPPGETNSCSDNNGGCTHICLPVGLTSRVCKCSMGYQLNPDNKTCRNSTSFIIVAQLFVIRGYSLDASNHHDAMVPVGGTRFVLSTDVLPQQQWIYFAEYRPGDSRVSGIRRVHPSGSEVQDIVTGGVGVYGFRGMAIDWVAGNLYFSNAFQVHTYLEVCRLDGSHRRIFYKTEDQIPHALVVNPIKRYLYFADFGNNPHIGRLDLSGENHTIIAGVGVQVSIDLCIDLSNHQVYWTDIISGTIERTDWDGSNRQIFRRSLADPRGITVYLNQVIWVDRSHQKVYSIDKTASESDEPSIIKEDLPDLRDVVVYDRQAKPQVEDHPCGGDSYGGCQQLCFAKPHGSQPPYICACSFGVLQADGRTCNSSDKFLLYGTYNGIRSHSVDESNHAQPIPPPVQNERNLMDFDYDYKEGKLFFIARGGIKVTNIHRTSGDTPQEPSTVVAGPPYLFYNVRIDHIHRRIYWNSRYRIFSANFDGSDRRWFSIGRSYAVMFEISPCHGYIFSVDRYWARGMKRSSLLGRQSREIYRFDSSRRYYSYFTLDIPAQMIYRVTTYSHSLVRFDFDGNNFEEISSSFFGSALTVSGDFVYSVFYRIQGIVRVEKDTSGGFSVLLSHSRQYLRYLKVYEDNNQQCVASACDISNGGCSHTCTRGANSSAECSCPANYRLVNNRRMCLPSSVSRCEDGEFTCANGQCIPMSWACDIDNDCGDMSDENDTYCFDHECEATDFTCDNGRCIHPAWLCDYDNDCRDNSDELNCVFPTCDPASDFTCSNSRCISREHVCDGFNHCSDENASDEQGCVDPEPCPADWTRCANNNLCIHNTYRCDGDNDCLDNSDENPIYCALQPCDPPYWRCPSGRCIPGGWYCDSDDDCGDASDEPDTCGTDAFICVEGYFTCDNGRCIREEWKCDVEDDCGDGSDESEDLNCDEHICQEDLYFTCTRNRPGSSRCIPLAWVCDAESDCENAEDEDGCPRRTCGEDQFVCDNGLCIPDNWKCDHDNDCGDESDEPPQCEYPDCNADQFLCQNGRCISIDWKCDGEDDCRDNSDEADSICNTAPPTCPPNNFRCANGQCIPHELVCNKVQNCDDESDEAHCDVDECAALISNQCEYSCVNTLTSYYCVCEDGYILNPDQKTCRDKNECTETPWVCSQICENLPGSYLCKCAEGYQRELDGATCKHVSDEEAILLFSNLYYVRKLTLDGHQYNMIADGFKGAVGMDFDLQDRKIFLIDVTDGSVIRMNLDGSEQEKIITDFVYGGEGIAVDWVGRKLYFVDRRRDVMEVAELDGSFRKTLIYHGLFEPRAVVVDPKHGVVYWTDWGLEPYIGRRGMDGSDAGSYIQDEKMVWPNGLSIDFAAEKLFWCDAHLDYIAYSDLDGSNRHELPGQPGDEVAHPFAVSVFEDWVYWTDWNVKGVYKAKKFSGDEQQLLVSTQHRPFDIHVMHSALHEVLENPCGTNNGGCSHMCLIALNGTSFQCACPDNFVLQPDDLTCFPNCSVQEYRCLDNSKCIPFYWKCDGNEDCPDSSDEPAHCPVRHCHARQFQCDNLNCTTAVELCNGADNCGDNSDERHCDATFCKPWEFRCNTGSCISHKSVCNQRDDCPDGSDENPNICHARECSPGYFKCGNGYCIPGAWVCDLDDDCGDGSDEIHRDCQARTCEPGWFSCRTNYRCIPSYAVCNDYDNCRDNSDEENCEERECGNGEFRCANHRCIPLRWQCDFEDDCRDNSDEEQCTYRECSESEFQCYNQRCIPSRWICDHSEDCDAGEDELDCENRQCQSDQFQCSSGHCISADYKCDGVKDCDDFSDEQDCPTRLPGGLYCFASQFTCTNTLCIPRSYVCDGWDDCGDNSDEGQSVCAVTTCDPETRFHCDNQKCIPLWLTCNGIDNCLDASDENKHGLCDPEPCNDDQYTCENQNCIMDSYVCDSFDDCGDQSDERGCNIGGSCSAANCQQKCTDITGGYICSCEKGYKLGEVTHLCEDIDECIEDNPCMQECINIKGSYMCSCIAGYQDHDHADGLGCKADEEERPWILFGDGIELRYFDTRSKAYDDVVYGEGKIQALDFTTETGVVYWTDASLKVIKRVRLPVAGGSQQTAQVVVRNKEADQPEGIAIDWVGGNMYWTDLGSRDARRTARDVEPSPYNGPRISVSKLDGRYIKILVKDDLSSLGYITVSPRKGVMYWTQSGSNARLETAWMDGTHRRTLASDLLEPSGLAVDYTRKDCVYFCDRKLNRIEVMNWDGSGRKLLKEGEELKNPFQLEVFETLLYWSTKSFESVESNSILQMNKLGTGIPVNTLTNLVHPTGVKVYHKLRYDIGEYNPCQEGYCSHLCLLTPLRDGNRALSGFTCACPEGDTFEPRSNSKCQGAVVEARTLPPPGVCNCINGGICLSDGTCKCSDGWSGPDCSRRSEKQTGANAGAAVGVTFAVLIILALIAVAAFFVLKNLREKKEDEVPVAYRDGKNIDLPLGAAEPPANGHTGTNGTSVPGNFENPMYGLQTAELQAVGFGDESAALPEKTGLPPDVVQESPIPLKSDDVVVSLPPSGADVTPSQEYNPPTYTPTEEEGDTNFLVTKD